MAERPPMTPELFDEGFASAAESPWLRAAFGEDLPEDVDPFSFITLDGLETLAEELRLEPGVVLVDLACGRGGPGLWLARRSGAHLIGIDWSPVGIEHARQRAQEMAPEIEATFTVARAQDTGLPDGSVGAVACIDAIQLIDEREAVLAEVARVLRLGGRVGLTTWESPGQLTGLERLITGAGLRIVRYEERPDWLEREKHILQRALDERGTSDDPGLANLADEAERVLPQMESSTRLLAVAERE
jgi:SAM-dependent methyltransferase